MGVLMKLYQFDEWYQQAVDYWSDPNHTECPDKCLEKLNQLKETVNSYFSGQGDNYKWFKRALTTMLSLRMEKYHMKITGLPNIPDVSAKYYKLTDLLTAFKMDLPNIEELFSTYTSTSSNCIQCGDSVTDDTTGTTTYTCLNTSVVDNLMTRIGRAPKNDVDTILDFLKSVETLDRSLFIMFKRDKLTIQADDISVYQLALECELDKVVQVYKWPIPGFNT